MMKLTKRNTPTLLSTLWVFILFNMIFRDLHQFLAKGYIEHMMTLDLPESTLLFYGMLLEIPIAMVLLSRILTAKFNKWFNGIAALILCIGLAMGLPSADLDDIFFSTVNLLALIIIGYMAIRRLPSET